MTRAKIISRDANGCEYMVEGSELIFYGDEYKAKEINLTNQFLDLIKGLSSQSKLNLETIVNELSSLEYQRGMDDTRNVF